MKRRILIVDDDQDLVAVLRDRLCAVGYDTAVAYHGSAALGVMSQSEKDHPIAGVLLDVMMPVMDGFATVQEIRMRYPTIPVLMMSAISDAAIREEALRNGATDFLVKTAPLETFVTCCRRCFGEGAAQTGSPYRG